jgi:hypothetical protein
VHVKERREALRLTSENRDEPWARPIERSADAIERTVGELARRKDGSLQREIARFGLGGPRGPNRLRLPEPSRPALELAVFLADLSLARLRARSADGGRVVVWNWTLQFPSEETPPSETRRLVEMGLPLGLPLLAACSDESVPAEQNAFDWAARWLFARQVRAFDQVHEDFTSRLSVLLLIEHELWKYAFEAGGPADRLPYALRFRAVEWFWGPEAHASGLDGFSLCMRCGVPFRPRRVISSPPRCAHCAKEPISSRDWPAHAIAPNGRGDWWLECQAGCGMAFIGRRHAKRCLRCRLSKITPSRRRAIHS